MRSSEKSTWLKITHYPKLHSTIIKWFVIISDSIIKFYFCMKISIKQNYLNDTSNLLILYVLWWSFLQFKIEVFIDILESCISMHAIFTIWRKLTGSLLLRCYHKKNFFSPATFINFNSSSNPSSLHLVGKAIPDLSDKFKLSWYMLSYH